MNIKALDVIYQPKGKAREYAELACNLYNGCSHSCTYCYAKRFDPEKYHTSANPKNNIVERVFRDIDILSKEAETVPEILFSFSGDVYQPAEMNYQFMPKIIDRLMQARLPFTVLTKGGTLAYRDFERLHGYPRYRFGTSLVFREQHDAATWEPHAAPVDERILTIQQAKMYGFPTWVSLEPVIDPKQTLTIIKELHTIIDFWKVGKINYNLEVEQSIDWIKFRDNVTNLFESLGAQYYLKKSLTELADGD